MYVEFPATLGKESTANPTEPFVSVPRLGSGSLLNAIKTKTVEDGPSRAILLFQTQTARGQMWSLQKKQDGN